ncbi:MAG: hypothetical protein AAF799_30025 [Myxococcota bacterium]
MDWNSTFIADWVLGQDGTPVTVDSSPGCLFVDRCGRAISEYWKSMPTVHRVDADHRVRCPVL